MKDPFSHQSKEIQNSNAKMTEAESLKTPRAEQYAFMSFWSLFRNRALNFDYFIKTR
jgi:hypothetical protein